MAKKDDKVIPNKVSPEVLRALADVVGDEWVTDDRAVIERPREALVFRDAHERTREPVDHRPVALLAVRKPARDVARALVREGCGFGHRVRKEQAQRLL